MQPLMSTEFYFKQLYGRGVSSNCSCCSPLLFRSSSLVSTNLVTTTTGVVSWQMQMLHNVDGKTTKHSKQCTELSGHQKSEDTHLLSSDCICHQHLHVPGLLQHSCLRSCLGSFQSSCNLLLQNKDSVGLHIVQRAWRQEAAMCGDVR